MTDAVFRPARMLPGRLLENARVLPSRDHILPLLPKGGVFCEVGVALGDFSELVLAQCEVSEFIAIDIYTLHDYPEMWGGRVGATLAGRRHADFFADRFAPYVRSGRVRLAEGNSTDVLATLPDASVDVFYVDAHHSYEAVRAELDIIKDKTRPEGIIILNDYIMHDYMTGTPYGVVAAAHDFMIEHDWEMLYFALHAGMFCDVAIRRARAAPPPG